MNIGQLKAELARYPDHWEVEVEYPEWYEDDEIVEVGIFPLGLVRNEGNYIVLQVP